MNGFRLPKSRPNVDSRATAIALVAGALATGIGVAVASIISASLAMWGG